MSYCGAIPVETEPSESRILIDTCLARVRKDAGLDDESVLPPLDVLINREPPRRFLVGPSVNHLPSAEAIVKSWGSRPNNLAESPDGRLLSTSSVNFAAPVDVREDGARRNVTTVHMTRNSKSVMERMRLRWPVFFCGFVAGIFGGAAVMKSPVGQTPAVQGIVKKAHSHAMTAYAATSAAAKSRLVKR